MKNLTIFTFPLAELHSKFIKLNTNAFDVYSKRIFKARSYQKECLNLRVGVQGGLWQRRRIIKLDSRITFSFGYHSIRVTRLSRMCLSFLVKSRAYIVLLLLGNDIWVINKTTTVQLQKEKIKLATISVAQLSNPIEYNICGRCIV